MASPSFLGSKRDVVISGGGRKVVVDDDTKLLVAVALAQQLAALSKAYKVVADGVGGRLITLVRENLRHVRDCKILPGGERAKDDLGSETTRPRSIALLLQERLVDLLTLDDETRDFRLGSRMLLAIRFSHALQLVLGKLREEIDDRLDLGHCPTVPHKIGCVPKLGGLCVAFDLACDGRYVS